MKRIIMLTALFLWSYTLPGQAQKESSNVIQNGDFEKFSGDDPVGWQTSNIPGTLTVVSSTPAGHRGTRAVKCVVKDFYGTKIAGYASQKDIPSRSKDLQLSGYYMIHSVGKDVAVVVVCFQNSDGSTMGTIEEYLRQEGSEFVHFARDFTAPAATATVQVRLAIVADQESGSLHPGTYAVFDDLKLVALPPKPKPAAQPVDSIKPG